MLLAGEFNCIPNIDNLIVYNLSSMIEGYQQIGILPSITDIDYIDELNFDIQYANYLMSTDYIFFEFFGKIIYPLYNGYDVYLLVTRNNLYDRITESLFKFIQQRYGYIAAIISDVSDVDYLNPDTGFGNTGVYGIANLDLDKSRYTDMYTYLNMDSNGSISGFD